MKLHEVIYDLLLTELRETGYTVVGADFKSGVSKGRDYILVSDSVDVYVVDIKKLEV